jgi:hypothetical protein
VGPDLTFQIISDPYPAPDFTRKRGQEKNNSEFKKPNKTDCIRMCTLYSTGGKILGVLFCFLVYQNLDKTRKNLRQAVVSFCFHLEIESQIEKALEKILV